MEFQLMYENLYYDNFEKFSEKITTCRNEKFYKDFSLLNNNNIVFDIDDMTVIPQGRFDVKINDVKFECVFSEKEKKNLYIILSGARSMREELPIFKRWSYSNFVDGSCLCVADPMLRKYDNLSLGWYYGSPEEDYYDYLVTIIKKITKCLNIHTENIVLYASSGGGYAALQVACRLSGVSVIAINPQIDLELYGYTDEFQRITKNDIRSSDLRNRLVENIRNNEESRFIFVENCRSKVDMVQIDTLRKQIGTSLEYGIQQISKNILVWVYDAECSPTHNAQDYPEMFFAINHLLYVFDKVEKYKALYEYFTELWHEHFKLVEKMNLDETKRECGIFELAFFTKTEWKRVIKPCLYSVDSIEKVGTKIYDFIKLHDAFVDNTLYGLSIENAVSEDNSCDCFTILIKNIEDNLVVYYKTVSLNQSCVLYFKTMKRANALNLRIYPSKPELTSGARIRLEDINLFCADTLIT